MAKSKVLHDPIAYKSRSTEKPTPFGGPRKEETTTGRYMAAGSDYGVGFKTPVGKESARALQAGPIPFGSTCFEPKDAIR